MFDKPRTNVIARRYYSAHQDSGGATIDRLPPITRRVALVGLTAKAERRIGGSFMFESQNTGHAIRDGFLKGAGAISKTPVVIIGGGIGGLSAAWWLRRNKCNDFVLLEIER